MFTGLIQAIGAVSHASNYELSVSWDTHQYPTMSEGIALGDSIAVDGVCLTVMQIVQNGFVAAVSPETVSRTTLSEGQIGTCPVNLESSLRVGSKVGGHFVTGHIDGVGYFESAIQTATSWEMSFKVPDARIARYIVPKGSISINGISLTVADCNPSGSWFKVAVIPVTYYDTNLQFLKTGSVVNLEGDVLGKYVEKFMRIRPSASTSDNLSEDELLEGNSIPSPMMQSYDNASITSSFLEEHGYS